MPSLTAALLLAFALGLLPAILVPAVRRALINGSRAVTRHADLWRLPVAFTVAYAAFRIAGDLLLHARTGDPLPLANFPDPTPNAFAAVLPALEGVASVFNVFVATMPLAAWFALLLLLNRGGLLGELHRALRKRFPGWRGLTLLAGLAVGAIAALLKPPLQLALPEVAPHLPWVVPVLLGVFAAAFELVLGVAMLTHLMLLTHVWLRGLSFHPAELRRLTVRRTGFVLKWSLVLVALTVTFVVLPIYAALLVGADAPLFAQAEDFSRFVGRPIVLAVAIVCLPLPAILAFHNESLRAALRDAARLLRRHALPFAAFVLLTATAMFALAYGRDAARAAWGAESWAGFGAQLALAVVEGGLTGWLIAAWVCLYKGLPAGRKEVLF